MDNKYIKRVQDLWGEFARTRNPNAELSWTDSDYISRNYINMAISGNPDVNWLIDALHNFIKQEVDWALNLGCGDGGVEIYVKKMHRCKNFDSIDISPEAVKVAVEKTNKENLKGLNFFTSNIKDFKSTENKYDVVFAAASLHHFDDLEALFDKVRHYLKKDGFFIFTEYVGPSQFQWTDRQLEIMNDILKMLPGSLRIDHIQNKTIKDQIRRMSIQEMNQMDPSEAIRSAEIMPLAEKYFHIIKRVDYGGTLLFWLLHGVIPSFNLSDPKDKTILDLIIYIEKKLIEYKVIPSDFTYVVAKNVK
jgi:SAM-dependent methyltransferase